MGSTIILAIDTSSVYCSIALLANGNIITSINALANRSHAQKLLDYIDEILVTAKITRQQLSCIAVGMGPGSFTGLRIAVTTAKMLSYALGIAVCPVPSLRAFDNSINGWHIVLQNAGRGEFYSMTYDYKKAELTFLSECEIINAEAVWEKVATAYKSKSSEVIVTSDDIDLLNRIGEKFPGAKLQDSKKINISFNLARIAWQMRKNWLTDFADITLLAPYYVRRSAAEERQ